MRTSLVRCLFALALIFLMASAPSALAQDPEKFRQRLEKNLSKKTVPLFEESAKALCVCHDAAMEGHVGVLQYDFQGGGSASFYKVYCMVITGYPASPPWTGIGSSNCNVWSAIPGR
ncbi:MAG: hypothetical protein WHX93_10195 [bacterium]